MFKIMKRIQKDYKNSEEYNTGLMGEHIIVASYKQMSLEKLIKLRFILNKIIIKKKDDKRIIESIRKNKNVQPDN